MEAWPAEDSPFVFEGPLPAEQVVGREREIASLVASARSGRAVSLLAPRRYGKTSLLNRVAAELRHKTDLVPVIVDLYGTHSLADLAVRLERAYSVSLRGPIRRTVERLLAATGLGLSLSAGGIGLVFQAQPRTDPLPALHAMLELPTRFADGDRRAWIVFDEFQAVMAIPDAEGLIRSHIQHQRSQASYVFAGSEPGLLARLFADPARPFYAQAETRRLGRLADAALAELIDRVFTGSGRSVGEALSALLRTAQGHPQRAMLLAHQLWMATGEEGVADDAAWLDALEATLRRTAPESEARYRSLSVNQQRVLRAVAGWGTPYARDAHARVGLAEGTVGAVVRQLLNVGDLEQRDGGGYRFVDPLFELWLRRQFTYR